MDCAGIRTERRSLSSLTSTEVALAAGWPGAPASDESPPPRPKALPLAPERASEASMYSGAMSGDASVGRIRRCSTRCGAVVSGAAFSGVAVAAGVAFMVLLVGGRLGPRTAGRSGQPRSRSGSLLSAIDRAEPMAMCMSRYW